MLRRGSRRVLVAGLAVVLLGLAWATWRAYQVRGDLEQGRALAAQVQADLTRGDLTSAEQRMPALRRTLGRAACRTEGLGFVVASRIPVLGRNFQAVRGTARAARVVGDEVLPYAVQALETARRGRLVVDGRVDLARLAQLRGLMHRAAGGAATAHRLAGSPPSLLVGPVSKGVEQARDQLAKLSATLRSADTALTLAPDMLGASGPRRFFIAVQNNAESRATGGLVGAFAIASTSGGRVTLERTGTDSELPVLETPVLSDPRGTGIWKRIGSTLAWYDANLTPHFPDAARNLAGLWERKSGQHLDGVIGLDPVVMSVLLTVTGPVKLADGTAVTSANVVDFVCHDEYVRYSDVPARKAILSTLAADLFHRMLSGADSVRTLHAFATAGASGHLFVWSAVAKEQALLAQGLVGGALPREDSPYLSVLTQNFGGNKLDYYIHRKVRVTRAPDGFVDVVVTLRNEAPLGLPDYMTVRSDHPKVPLPYGTANVGLAVYGAWSSEIAGITVDGRQRLVDFDHDHGSRLGVITLELPRNKDLVVKIRISEPAGVLTYRQQPLIRPDDLRIHVQHRVVGR